MIILSTLTQIQIPGGTLQAPSSIPSGDLGQSGSKVFQTGLDLLFYLAAFLAVVMVVISGIQWIASGGDPGRIAGARKRLLYSIIGLLVVASAFLILNVLTGILGKNPTDILTP